MEGSIGPIYLKHQLYPYLYCTLYFEYVWNNVLCVQAHTVVEYEPHREGYSILYLAESYSKICSIDMIAMRSTLLRSMVWIWSVVGTGRTLGLGDQASWYKWLPELCTILCRVSFSYDSSSKAVFYGGKAGYIRGTGHMHKTSRRRVGHDQRWQNHIASCKQALNPNIRE